jgi:Uma2 family endonuclease
MATVVMDRKFAELLREERAAAGSDRWDEVWEGTYMMSPLPNNEHQQIATRIGAICEEIVGWGGNSAVVLVGTNVSDREEGWEHNYRCPDVVVYLPGTTAKNCDTHWCGGPDFGVEIASRDDATREKIGFYAKVRTGELLIVDREPWQLELLRLDGGELKSVGVSTIDSGHELRSAVLPLIFRLTSGETRPTIQVAHPVDEKTWDV